MGTVSAAMPRHKTRHPPPSLRCPHCGGLSRDLFYHSSYRTRDGPRNLWRCRRCGKGLSERRGTAFFNLKTPEAEVAPSLDAMLRGDTQTSTAQTRRHRRETLRRWRRRAAPRARAVDAEFVTDLRVTDLELDEQWSFAGSKKAPFADNSQRGEAWWHKAMARASRLLVEQFVSPRTPEAAELLVNRSFDRLAPGCLPRISSDGYDAYTKPLSEQVRALTVYPLRWALVKKGKPGRPPKPQVIPDPTLVYGQVADSYTRQSTSGGAGATVFAGWNALTASFTSTPGGLPGVCTKSL